MLNDEKVEADPKMHNTSKLSIIIPAKNEALSLSLLLPALREAYPQAEIIVVDDGSIDDTEPVCQRYSVRIISHPYSKGNGAAIKTGARAATRELLVLMDADNQHRTEDIQRLLLKLEEGYDMVVGARTISQQTKVRSIGNWVYNQFATYVVGHPVLDLTSGFRVAKASVFKQFLPLFPNGFSYPSTVTLAFFRSGYSVAYQEINAHPRMGKSHLKILKDGIRFFLIIYKITTLYSPLKIFVPLSFLHFIIAIGYYLYTFLTQGRFTNMGAVFLTASVIIFLIGLVSEQITMMLYMQAAEATKNEQ